MADETQAEVEDPEVKALAEAAAEKGEGLTLKLLRPITSKEGTTLDTLQFRAMRFADMVGIDLAKGISLQTALDMTSRLTGQPPKVIGQLWPKDALRCVTVVATFSVGGR